MIILNYSVLSGIHSSDCSRHPAAGYRNRGTGVLTNIGSGGYVWSSSPISATSPNASFVGFKMTTSTYVEPFRSDSRSYGLSVRCVQHLPKLLS